jgi:hypothetical protein
VGRHRAKLFHDLSNRVHPHDSSRSLSIMAGPPADQEHGWSRS